MADDNANRNRVVIERIFDAPPEVIWQMWTEPDHFKAWYGPDGVTIPVAILDVENGGRRIVSMAMATPAGPMQMWFTGEHREVVKNQRLVYTESIADENGNVLSPQAICMPEDHPTATEVTVELVDLGGRTKVVLTHAGIAADSPGAAGWAMAFDKLAEYVEAPNTR